MAGDPLSRPEDWTRYLRNYTVTSFGRMFPDNYDGAIREFWEQLLTTEIPDQLVDICCGNGALCWIADEILNQDDLRTQIIGVDFADIDPFGVLRRDPADYPGVRFIGNTLAEGLPFADCSIDIAISQYGIEYTDLGRSIPELVRVLKAGGRMAFIMHDADSEVVNLSTRHLKDMQTVLDLDIHGYVLKLFDMGLQLRTPEQRQASDEYRELIGRLNDLTNQVRGIVQGYEKKTPIHKYMNRLMGVFGDPASASNPESRNLIIAAEANLSSHVTKIEHLSDASLSANASNDLVSLIESSGCTVTMREPFEYAPGVPIGTALVAVRKRD